MRKTKHPKKKYTSMSFSNELVGVIRILIKGTGYKNPTEWATTKLRSAVNEDMKKLDSSNKEIKKRLASMGYKIEE